MHSKILKKARTTEGQTGYLEIILQGFNLQMSRDATAPSPPCSVKSGLHSHHPIRKALAEVRAMLNLRC